METGSRIGPYEILGFLGAGAMGEVHRARDPRLGRDVAIKTLPAALGLEPERLRRFEVEARSAGTRNHPNILTIFDVGAFEGTPYLVSELLEGATLRERLAEGALPLKRALDLGAQAARGLAAAHARGIVHRDLKPENLFVTAGGTLKILDFGLAKLVENGTKSHDDSLAGTMTGAGTLMGTVGYMAPEQVRGQPATTSSDLFALGCVLYEMLTGARAFKRESPVETMSAILNEDPPEFPERLRAEAPAAVAIVLRLLEKAPEERYESARDLAFSLTALAQPDRPKRAAQADDAGAQADVESRVPFRRLTFRRGSISRARFAPDGRSFIYGGAWEGQPVETFWNHIGNPEGRSVSQAGTDLFGVGPQGELAVCLKRHQRAPWVYTGTLARTPVGGGAARPLLQGVDEADWSPDGNQIAIVREVNSLNQLEYPMGKILFQTAGWISHIRVSRDGSRVAFIHHEYVGNDAGSITVVDTAGKVSVPSPHWGTVRGLAWSADGREIWFTANREGAGRNLYAVDLEGRLRALHEIPGQLCIHDVFPDGRALISNSVERQVIMVHTASDTGERDLSWLDWSILRDISPDGQWVLIIESGEGGGSQGAICIRPTDGSPAVQIGEGEASGFSPDGMWVIALVRRPGQKASISLLPTGVGEAQAVNVDGLDCRAARWIPNTRSLVVAGEENEGQVRLHRIDVDTGKRSTIGPDENVSPQFEVSPDGRAIVAVFGERPMMLYPVDGGDPSPIPGIRPDDVVQPWTAESEAILVSREGVVPARVDRIDVTTGARTLWREIAPADGSGVLSVRRIRFMPDGQTYGYSYLSQLDDLYLVENLR
jgi:dipeptidyl aminopeptidase/acylaminoacyl peptidase